jgi:recombination protein RecA
VEQLERLEPLELSNIMSSFAHELRHDIVQPSRWTLREIAGRFVEISASTCSAALTLAFGLVREAQERSEPVGWVTTTGSFFYPPDVAQRGVDLAALAVIRVLDAASIPRAGEKLLRSGGFGLVVLDLETADVPMPLQSRLTGLAQHHHTGVVCLTEKQNKTFSLGSLISLRVHAERQRHSDNRFTCQLRILKDKRWGPTWSYEELCRGPAGLC